MRKTLLLLLVLAATGALAQSFPSRKVSFVSGVTPGSASDTMARILAEKLPPILGQPVIVENRLGAGGIVGAKFVAAQEPDGHYIMMYTSAFTVSTLLNPGFDPKEMVPVATVATIPTDTSTTSRASPRPAAWSVRASRILATRIICRSRTAPRACGQRAMRPGAASR